MPMTNLTIPLWSNFRKLGRSILYFPGNRLGGRGISLRAGTDAPKTEAPFPAVEAAILRDAVFCLNTAKYCCFFDRLAYQAQVWHACCFHMDPLFCNEWLMLKRRALNRK